MHVNGVGIISGALARVIAWYACEGSVSGNNLVFAIGAHETQFSEDLRKDLQACGFKSTQKVQNGVCVVSVNSVILSDFLVGQCGSHSLNKRLPLSLLRGNEITVWHALISGDGCIYQPKKPARPVYTFATISEGLAQQVQIIGASIGYTGSITKTDAKEEIVLDRKIQRHASYYVQMRKHSGADGRGNCKTKSAKNGALGKVKKISREKFCGFFVYNLTVAGDNSYVVNGRAVHNCEFVEMEGSLFNREDLDDMHSDGDSMILRPTTGGGERWQKELIVDGGVLK